MIFIVTTASIAAILKSCGLLPGSRMSISIYLTNLKTVLPCGLSNIKSCQICVYTGILIYHFVLLSASLAYTPLQWSRFDNHSHRLLATQYNMLRSSPMAMDLVRRGQAKHLLQVINNFKAYLALCTRPYPSMPGADMNNRTNSSFYG